MNYLVVPPAPPANDPNALKEPIAHSVDRNLLSPASSQHLTAQATSKQIESTSTAPEVVPLAPEFALSSPASAISAAPAQLSAMPLEVAPPESVPPLQAQNADPNRDRFLNPIVPPPALPQETPTVLPTLPDSPSTNPPTSDPSTLQKTVQKIEVTGSTIFSSQTLEQIVKPFEGRTLTLAEIQGIADRITQRYLEQGYLTSQAVLVEPAAIVDVVQIRVIEGSLERIEIEGAQRLNQNYIRNRVQLGVRQPLNATQLEDQLRLLRADPLFTEVDASLRPGEQAGQSVLKVRVKEANAVSGSVSFDNYAPPSVGAERVSTRLSYRNLTGSGDELNGFYARSTTGGLENYGATYRLPLNPMNGTLQLRAERTRNEITEAPFDELGIRGKSELYELSYRQPLVRTAQEEFALSLGFTYQNGQTFIFNDLPNPFGIGPDDNGVSRTSVIKFGQDYTKRDAKGWWALQSQFSFGTGLLGATQNPAPIPDGNFFSWSGQVQRVQKLSSNQVLIAQADLQLTPHGLLPSQQFVIGGGQSLRGYRQNARSGDNGFRVSLEDRITLSRDAAGNSTFQLAPFVDAGAVWNASGNPNQLPNRNFLASVGLGVLWQPLPALNMRLDYGIPLISISDRGRNLQDSGLYLSVNYQF